MDYKKGWIEAYNQSNDENLWDTEPLSFIQNYIDLFTDKSEKVVLDAGCGDGRNSILLLKNNFYTVGLDLSSKAIERANIKATRLGLNKHIFLNGDIEKLPTPFSENSFDIIFCLDVFGQLKHTKEVIESFFKILKKNGYLLLNLYTDKDAAYGEGVEIEKNSFFYSDTLFKFFTKEDIYDLFSDYNIKRVDHVTWTDPPHDGYRDSTHKHDSYVVLVQKNNA